MCRTRKRLGLTGAYPEHAHYMCRKNDVFEIAKKGGIPLPKTMEISFRDQKLVENYVQEITSEIPSFPLFRKPQMLMGLRGVGKIESKKDLEVWIKQRLDKNDDETYIIQEYATGTEFTVSTVLLQDGSWVPLVVKYVAFEWTHSYCLSTGKPVVSINEPFELAEQTLFPGIRKFASNVIETFKPMHPQVFCFQGFQRTKGKDDYVLNELAYRPAGERVNPLCYDACGVNQYTALILASIDPNYSPKPKSSWKRRNITGIWYPQREGNLAEHSKFPEPPEINGRIMGQWNVSVNEHMEKAKNMNQMICTLFLESQSDEDRNRDIEWIAKNWTPKVDKT
ncbi:hypothetical protein L596_022707 [Steinernema carpocapsae]|nr:hypothetical protein L596_022707 [Steinernema carpocapsae]